MKTPGGIPLLLEKERLPVAVLIAEEWENQMAVLKPHTLPMVRLWVQVRLVFDILADQVQFSDFDHLESTGRTGRSGNEEASSRWIIEIPGYRYCLVCLPTVSTLSTNS